MQDLNVLTLDFVPFVLALDHNKEISAERTEPDRDIENAGSVRCLDRLKACRGISLEAKSATIQNPLTASSYCCGVKGMFSSRNRIE